MGSGTTFRLMLFCFPAGSNVINTTNNNQNTSGTQILCPQILHLYAEINHQAASGALPYPLDWNGANTDEHVTWENKDR